MFILMLVGFFSVRIVLKALGIENYGIYNVVGGVVAMFQFLQGSLTTASQRYFSVEIASGSKESLNRIFCLNTTVFLILGIVVVALCETIGLWFLNNKMIIPESRLFAANVVFQLSLVSFIFKLISIPYNALIVSFERMTAFAWLGLVEGFLKLGIAIILLIINGDKLIEYGLLMTLMSIGVTLLYINYCNRNLEGSRFHLIWDKAQVKELFAFSGWHFLGTMSVVVRGTGVNLLINTFFSPVVNAGRAIGYQVENIVGQFSSNYFTAVKPQMYKSYSMGQYDDLFNLINRSTILSMYLVSLFAIPIIINMEYVLHLWLGKVPAYAVAFGSLALINCFIDTTGSPTIAPALAHGKIRNFEIAISVVACMNLPFSYVALRIGMPPQTTVIISIALSIVAVFVRVLFLRRMIGFPYTEYLNILLRVSIITMIVFLFINYLKSFLLNDLLRLIVTGFLSVIFISLGYLLVLTPKDRNKILDIALKRIRH